MTPAETTRLIAVAGGDTAFGALLGIDHNPGYQQRINNWKRRGIPPSVILEHMVVINSLRAKLGDGAALPSQERVGG